MASAIKSSRRLRRTRRKAQVTHRRIAGRIDSNSTSRGSGTLALFISHAHTFMGQSPIAKDRPSPGGRVENTTASRAARGRINRAAVQSLLRRAQLPEGPAATTTAELNYLP